MDINVSTKLIREQSNIDFENNPIRMKSTCFRGMTHQNASRCTAQKQVMMIPSGRSTLRQVGRRMGESLQGTLAVLHDERHGQAPGQVHIKMAVHEPHTCMQRAA
ncbi:hypothetical protein BHM03_00021606 [Ensete ventricosum]|nr:hypothetical protein BHM03_00021606 [Ensete ventricosum]